MAAQLIVSRTRNKIRNGRSRPSAKRRGQRMPSFMSSVSTPFARWYATPSAEHVDDQRRAVVSHLVRDVGEALGVARGEARPQHGQPEVCAEEEQHAEGAHPL